MTAHGLVGTETLPRVSAVRPVFPAALLFSLVETAPPADAHAVVLFDGVCNLCNTAVNFIIDRDAAGYFRFAALQSEEARPLLSRCGAPAGALETETLESIVVVEGGRCYRHSEAGLRIARRLGPPWSLAYAFMAVPRPLRDAAYEWLARRRYDWFGQRGECRVPTPELRERFLVPEEL